MRVYSISKSLKEFCPIVKIEVGQNVLDFWNHLILLFHVDASDKVQWLRRLKVATWLAHLVDLIRFLYGLLSILLKRSKHNTNKKSRYFKKCHTLTL